VSDGIKQCEGITRAGRRCRRSAKAGGAFCGLHNGSRSGAGAPVGNVSARKHGFYSELFTDEEIERLAAAGASEGLADEIGMLRVRIHRALTSGSADLDAVGRACGRLTQMLKAQRVLTGDAASEFERAMSEVLASVTEELGLSLS
jgi:hypothetical protein